MIEGNGTTENNGMIEGNGTTENNAVMQMVSDANQFDLILAENLHRKHRNFTNKIC